MSVEGVGARIGTVLSDVQAGTAANDTALILLDDAREICDGIGVDPIKVGGPERERAAQLLGEARALASEAYAEIHRYADETGAPVGVAKPRLVEPEGGWANATRAQVEIALRTITGSRPYLPSYDELKVYGDLAAHCRGGDARRMWAKRIGVRQTVSLADIQAMPEDQIVAHLRDLIGEGTVFPQPSQLNQVSGLRAAVEQLGGVERWARRLGVAPPPPSKAHVQVQDHEVEELLGQTIERLGHFPSRVEAGKSHPGLWSAIQRTRGATDWAQHFGVDPPKDAATSEELRRWRTTEQIAARRREAIAWKPPERLPDTTIQLEAMLEELDRVVPTLEQYAVALLRRQQEIKEQLEDLQLATQGNATDGGDAPQRPDEAHAVMVDLVNESKELSRRVKHGLKPKLDGARYVRQKAQAKLDRLRSQRRS